MSCMHARIDMEEKYSRIIIDYTTTEDKNLLCALVHDICHTKELTPQIILTPKSKESGVYSVEFSKDYDQMAKDFYEELLEKLGIKVCDID